MVEYGTAPTVLMYELSKNLYSASLRSPPGYGDIYLQASGEAVTIVESFVERY